MDASIRRQTAPFRTVAAACLTLLAPGVALAQESGRVRVQFGQHSAWGQNARLPADPARVNYSGAPQSTAYVPEQHLRLKPVEFGGR